MDKDDRRRLDRFYLVYRDGLSPADADKYLSAKTNLERMHAYLNATMEREWGRVQNGLFDLMVYGSTNLFSG